MLDFDLFFRRRGFVVDGRHDGGPIVIASILIVTVDAESGVVDVDFGDHHLMRKEGRKHEVNRHFWDSQRIFDSPFFRVFDHDVIKTETVPSEIERADCDIGFHEFSEILVEVIGAALLDIDEDAGKKHDDKGEQSQANSLYHQWTGIEKPKLSLAKAWVFAKKI